MKACRVETGTVNGSRAGVSVCEEPHLPGRTRKKNLCLKNLPLRTIEAHDEADFYKSPCQRSRSHSRRAAGNLLTSVNGCGIIRPEKHAAERGGKGRSMRKHLSRESNMQGGIFVRYGWNCFKTGSFFRFRYPSDPCRRLPNRMAGNPCGLQDGSGCT